MNNNQHFDENIKELFSNYVPDVHPRIWENIVAEKERRKPVGFWFNLFNGRTMLILLGLLIAVGTGTILLINHSNETKNTKNNISSLNEKDKSNQNNQTTSSPNKNNLTDNNKNDATVLSNENNLSAKENETNSIVVNSKAVTKIRIFSPSLQTSNDESIAENKKENNKDDLNPDNLSIGGSLFGRLLFDAQKISIQQKNNLSKLQKNHVPFFALPGCPEMEKNASGNKKYLEIYGGPDLAIRQLSDTGNSVYLQKRKQSTNVSSAFSLGIRYTKVFNNSVSIRTGINYSQINEKFSFVAGNVVQITYIIDANGDTTGSYITTGTRYKTTYNKFRSIDVPVLIGYELGNGRLHANINAGIVINVYSWQKGEVLDTSYQPVNITTGKTSSPYQFKTNAGVGFMAGVSAYYKLNDNIHLLAEPYFRYNFSPLSKDNLTLKQKYTTVGLRFGVRMDLK